MSLPVGVLGATSFLGRALVPRLTTAGWHPIPISRRPRPDGDNLTAIGPVAHWIALCPIWALGDHFQRLEDAGCKRIVAISSTSRFTKQKSADAGDRETAARLAAGEEAVLDWAERRGVTATVLRPTLIYDGTHDRNVATIVAWIGRWGFFPVIGPASGLRQPVHVDDVAAACVAALTAGSPGPAYDISGGEVLPYRRMLERVFQSLGRPPRIVSLPRWVISLGVSLLGAMPRYRHVTMAMFDRVNEDLVFDHAAAARDLGFTPRPFVLPSGPSRAHP